MAIALVEMFDIDAQEEGGLIVEIVRRVRLSGLTQTDYDDRVAEVYAASVLPASGTTITLNTYSTLILRQRRMVLGQACANDEALVDLTYRRIDDPGGAVPARLRGTTSLKQITTDKDKDGNAFFTQHTWAATDTGIFPNGTPRAGETEKQYGSVTVYRPTVVLYGELLYEGSNPGNWQAGYVGKVNNATWQGGAARTWLCHGGDILPIEETGGTPKWIVGFRFEYDDATWDDGTTIAFVDPNTGRFPEGLVDGTGRKTITYYTEANFSDLF